VACWVQAVDEVLDSRRSGRRAWSCATAVGAGQAFNAKHVGRCRRALLSESDTVRAAAASARIAVYVKANGIVLTSGAVAGIDADARPNAAQRRRHVAVDNGDIESTDGIGRLGQDAVALRVLDHVAVKLDSESWRIGHREVLIDPDRDA